MLRCIKEAPEQAIDVPLLVCGAEFEQVVDADAARTLYDDAPVQNKILKIYDSLFHDLFHEPERQDVFDDVAAWIAAQLTVKSEPEDTMSVHQTRVRFCYSIDLCFVCCVFVFCFLFVFSIFCLLSSFDKEKSLPVSGVCGSARALSLSLCLSLSLSLSL
jgi:hypothetical protein